MAMRDEDFGTDLNLVVGDDGDWSPPRSRSNTAVS